MDTRYWIQDINGYMILDTRYNWIQDTGYKVMATRCWIQGTGLRLEDNRYRTQATGYRTQDKGFRT